MSNNYQMPREPLQLFGGAATFMRVPFCGDMADSNADIIITGAPLDMCTTGRAGARSGPWAIRQVSSNLVWEQQRFPWPYALADKMYIEDCGDLAMDPGNPKLFVEQLEQHIYQIAKLGKKPLTLGGDHFVALPCLRGLAAVHGPLALIHFDAHTDTYEDGELNHGTMFHHGVKEGIIDVEHSVQIGIRTNFTREGHPYLVLDAPWCNGQLPSSIIEAIKARVGDRKVYLTFDIDCLDPAFAPGTGTPVVGGLTSDMALKIVGGLRGLNFVGMDMVEVAPAYDHSEITALAAATIAVEWLYSLT